MSDEAELRARLSRPYRSFDVVQLHNQREYYRARQLVAQREIDTTMRELAVIDDELASCAAVDPSALPKTGSE